jgi:hypothetical protein
MGSQCSDILQKGWKLDYNSDFWLFLYTELFDAYSLHVSVPLCVNMLFFWWTPVYPTFLQGIVFPRDPWHLLSFSVSDKLTKGGLL